MAIHTWAEGDLLTATDLNNNFTEKLDIPDDTGWVFIPETMVSPWTSTLYARRIGNDVELHGKIDPNGTVWGAINNPQTLVDNLPVIFTPSETRAYQFATDNPNSAGINFRCTIQSNRAIVARCSSVNNNDAIMIDCRYWVD